jgi:NTP pyrophosphatase (non-canonical NTP hydrolase)
MEERLLENDYKGGGEDCTPAWLLKRLGEELKELRKALRAKDSPERIACEAADVANFAMMIADVTTFRGSR